MSRYENYHKAADHYDDFRVAAGLNVVLGAVPGDLSAARVLDAGSGTGNYALAIAPHVLRITALDANEAMNARLRRKLESQPEVVRRKMDVVEASLTSIPLPFEDDSFDFILMNMVAHHLDAEPPYPNLRRLLAEFRRLLRPGGVVVVGTIVGPTFYLHWLHPYVQAIPSLRDAVPDFRMAFSPELEGLCRDAGFDTAETKTTSEHYHGLHYCNFSAIFDPAFRAANSGFRHLPAEGVDEMLDRIAADMKAGALVEKIRDAEQHRKEKGACAFVIARKEDF